MADDDRGLEDAESEIEEPGTVEEKYEDDEGERRSRAAEAQTRRMFNNLDKSYNDHTDVESPVEDINEDELAAELDELETELQDELDGDGE